MDSNLIVSILILISLSMNVFLDSKIGNRLNLFQKTIDNNNSLIKTKDSVINNLNQKVINLHREINRIEPTLDLLQKRLGKIHKYGSIVAISYDNHVYYSFEVKKESGIIITRSKGGKPEKVKGFLGIEAAGIVYVFHDNGVHPFNPAIDYSTFSSVASMETT